MAAYVLTLLLLLPLVQAFPRATDDTIIEKCHEAIVPKILVSEAFIGDSCCKIMLDDLNSSERGVLNYELFKEAFTGNGLPDPGKEQYAYFKLYGCKYSLTSFNESGMFLTRYIRAIHAKLIKQNHCKSRDNCKHKPNDTNTLAPELWAWNVDGWMTPPYSIFKYRNFGDMVKFLLETKGCKHVKEMLEIYNKVRQIFNLAGEEYSSGCVVN